MHLTQDPDRDLARLVPEGCRTFEPGAAVEQGDRVPEIEAVHGEVRPALRLVPLEQGRSPLDVNTFCQYVLWRSLWVGAPRQAFP